MIRRVLEILFKTLLGQVAVIFLLFAVAGVIWALHNVIVVASVLGALLVTGVFCYGIGDILLKFVLKKGK